MSKNLLVVGGNGALGKSVVKEFKKEILGKNSWSITSLDLSENQQANHNISLDKNFVSDSKYVDLIHLEIDKIVKKYDSIICVAGGFEAVGITSNSIIKSTNNMMNMNFYSSLLTVHLAQKYLFNDSLLVLTGAASIRNKSDNSGILSYQLAKQGVESITDTIIQYPKLLPINTKVVTICPSVIDTENNRRDMPNADTSKWTSPEKIANLLRYWAESPKNAPKDTYYLV